MTETGKPSEVRQVDQKTPPAVPLACQWLGGLGVIPFLGLAIASLWLEGIAKTYAIFGLNAYGAVILSFLGGIQWGLAAADFGAGHGKGTTFRRLIVSVVPSLVAWGALLMGGDSALYMLAVSFALMFLVDWSAAQQEEAPPWYPKLRLPLTASVVACLLVGAIF